MTDETKAPLVQLTIKNVLADLAAGLNRKEIGDKYGLDKNNTALLFKEPKLMGKKTHPKVIKQFNLVDDAPDVKPMPPIVRKKKEPVTETVAAIAPEVAVVEEVTAEKGVW